jgi:hypothetical protein
MVRRACTHSRRSARQEPPSITGGSHARTGDLRRGNVWWWRSRTGPSPGGIVRQGADLPWVHALHEGLRDSRLRARRPEREYGLVLRHLRASLGTAPRPPSPPGPRPDVWIWSLSDDLLRVRHVSRGSTGYAWGWRPRRSTQGATVSQRPKRAAYWANQLGTASLEVLVEANSQAIGLVFSDSCRSHPPVMCPSSLRPGVTPKPTPRASICCEDSRPLNLHQAPDGPCPRSGTKSRAVRHRGALRQPHR